MASSWRFRAWSRICGETPCALIKQRRPCRHFVERFDEDGPALAKSVDDVLVVNDLVIDVERRAEKIERPLKTLDRHIDAGTEASRIGQQDLH